MRASDHSSTRTSTCTSQVFAPSTCAEDERACVLRQSNAAGSASLVPLCLCFAEAGSLGCDAYKLTTSHHSRRSCWCVCLHACVCIQSCLWAHQSGVGQNLPSVSNGRRSTPPARCAMTSSSTRPARDRSCMSAMLPRYVVCERVSAVSILYPSVLCLHCQF